jgi:hypothetical protein
MTRAQQKGCRALNSKSVFTELQGFISLGARRLSHCETEFNEMGIIHLSPDVISEA